MKKLLACSACAVLITGCGAATTPGTLSEDRAKRVTVVKEFTLLDMHAGVEPGAVAPGGSDLMTGKDLALIRTAMIAGLEREGLLAKEVRPGSIVLGLEVVRVSHRQDNASVTLRMTIQDKHNRLVLGRADVIGESREGARRAALSAVDAIVELLAGKMNQAP